MTRHFLDIHRLDAATLRAILDDVDRPGGPARTIRDETVAAARAALAGL